MDQRRVNILRAFVAGHISDDNSLTTMFLANQNVDQRIAACLRKKSISCALLPACGNQLQPILSVSQPQRVRALLSHASQVLKQHPSSCVRPKNFTRLHGPARLSFRAMCGYWSLVQSSTQISSAQANTFYDLSCHLNQKVPLGSALCPIRRQVPTSRGSIVQGRWNNGRPLNCRYKTSPSCVSVREERPCMLGDVSCRLENRHSRTTTVRRSASLCFVSRRHSPGRVTKPASVSALAFSRRHSPERESALVPVHAKWKPYNGLEQFEQL